MIGESQSDYGSNIICHNPINNSLFLSGFANQGAVAEFGIPSLVTSEDITLLNTAPVLQNFKKVIDLSPDGNPQNIDRISGLFFHNGSLIVNAVEYYDAAATNTHTTLVISNASDLASSAVNGFYSLQGGAHVAG